MQGAFCEMDDDIGWNDFALRNYDPQIGRWVQVDPYGDIYIASPYVGMGNDPVNTIDPSGANIFQGVSLAGRIASGAIIGAVAAGVFDAATGRDNLIDGAIGTVLGAVIGGTNVLTATKVIIQVANTANTVINTSITAIQAGNSSAGSNSSTDGDKALNNPKMIGSQIAQSFQVDAGHGISSKDRSYKPYGRVDVAQFNQTNNGLTIELLYKDQNSGFSDFRWIQTIYTDAPLGGATSPYNDPQPPDDDKLFYWTDQENPIENRAPGYNARFYDSPHRGTSANWSAELTLVARDKTGKFVALITFTYGFTIDANLNVTLKIISIKLPSPYQSKTIQYAR